MEQLQREKDALYSELEMSKDAYLKSGVNKELRLLQKVIEGLEVC